MKVKQGDGVIRRFLFCGGGFKIAPVCVEKCQDGAGVGDVPFAVFARGYHVVSRQGGELFTDLVRFSIIVFELGPFGFFGQFAQLRQDAKQIILRTVDAHWVTSLAFLNLLRVLIKLYAFCLTKKHHFAGRVSVEPNSAIFSASADIFWRCGSFNPAAMHGGGWQDSPDTVWRICPGQTGDSGASGSRADAIMAVRVSARFPT